MKGRKEINSEKKVENVATVRKRESLQAFHHHSRDNRNKTRNRTN